MSVLGVVSDYLLAETVVWLKISTTVAGQMLSQASGRGVQHAQQNR